MCARAPLPQMVIDGWLERTAQHRSVVSASMLVREVHRKRIHDAIRSPTRDVVFVYMDAPVETLVPRSASA